MKGSSAFIFLTLIASEFIKLAGCQGLGKAFYSECLRGKANCIGISHNANKKLAACWNKGKECKIATKIIPNRPENYFDVYVQYKADASAATYGAVAIGKGGFMFSGLFVMECVSTNSVEGFTSSVKGKTKPIREGGEDTEIPTSAQVVVKGSLMKSGGYIHCQFRIDEKFFVRFDDKSERVFSLVDEKYSVILAYGFMANKDLIYHVGRSGYMGTFNWSEIGALGGNQGGLPPMIKLHGILMTLAYITFVPTATIIARFFKETWSTRQFCGKRVWFCVHTVLLFTAMLMTCSAYGIMVWYKDEWVPNFGGGMKHAVMGLSSITIMISQTVIPWFLGPAANLSIKRVYSRIHAFLGFVSYTLGVVNIALIDYLMDGYLSCQVTLLSWLWIGLHASLYIFFTTLLYIKDHDMLENDYRSRAFFAYPMKMQTIEDAPGRSVRVILLLVYITLSLLMSAAHIYFIGIPLKFSET